MTDTRDRFRDWDAAYVLGALDADDRRDYELHLQTCQDCASAVAELAGLPGILSKLPVPDALRVLGEPDAPTIGDDHLRDTAHTPGLVQRLAVSANRRRRRNRISAIVVGLAVVALVAVGGVSFIANQTTVPTVVAMTPLHQKEITAKLAVTEKGWGTRFDWSCSYYDGVWEGTPVSYDLVVTEKDGTQKTVATWSTAGPQAKGLTASSAIPTDSIRSVQIRLTGSTTPLLSETL